MVGADVRKKPGPSGERTREKLLAAALELFGRKGFDGTGAREITAAAGVPLAALPHHYGTKEALYRATLERVRTRMSETLAPAAAEASAALQGSPADAARALASLQGALLDALAVNPEAESWAKLLLREHFDPGAGFALVYEDAARSAIELLASLIAHGSRRLKDDPDVLIQAFACMGQVLVFRITQHAVTRRLGWAHFDAKRAQEVKDALGWS